MAANINDKLIEAENGGNPQPTTVSSARSIGGTSLSCVALTNWPTATAVHLITYKKKTDGTMDRTTLCLWKGIVSGTTIGTLTLKGGTDAGNSVGDFVEMAPTSSQWQDLYDGLTAEHNNDGTHSDITADSVTINSGGTVDMSSAETVNYKPASIGASALATGAIRLGYVEITANYSNSGGPNNVTGLSVTVTAPGSHDLLATFKGTVTSANGSGTNVTIGLYEGSTLIDSITYGATQNYPFGLVAPFIISAPSAGSHTYNIKMTSGSSGTIVASSTSKAYLLLQTN